MKFCTECGNENPKADNPFCIHCGAKIEANVIIPDLADSTQTSYHLNAETNEAEVVLDAHACRLWRARSNELRGPDGARSLNRCRLNRPGREHQ